MSIEAGDRVAIIGENGVGKTTLLRLLAGEKLGGLAPLGGHVKWAEKARPGVLRPGPRRRLRRGHHAAHRVDRAVGARPATKAATSRLIRGTLGRLLFSGDEAKKPVNVISGGEQGRMLFGKLMLLRNNVLLMDEPTNHLDMESIESLNTALEKYPGTLIFVSHDREFVSSLATRIIDIRPDRTIVDYRGSYEEYLASQGLG
jgi:ATPase subunit of ABC transporter with duplicated ATPase domains